MSKSKKERTSNGASTAQDQQSASAATTSTADHGRQDNDDSRDGSRERTDDRGDRGRQNTDNRDGSRGRQQDDRNDRGRQPRREDMCGYSDEIIGIDRFTNDAVFRTRGGVVFSVEPRKAAPTPAPVQPAAAPAAQHDQIMIVRESAPAPQVPPPGKNRTEIIIRRSLPGLETFQHEELWDATLAEREAINPGVTREEIAAGQKERLAGIQEAANAALPRITPAQFDQDRAKARREGQSTAHKWWLAGLGILAAVIAAAVIGWAVHGCGHDDLPPASAQQTIVVPAQAPACNPVIVSPVVVTTPAPVVNVTTPETRVVTRTITKEVPVKTPAQVQAPAVSAPVAGPYVLNVRTEPAPVAQASVVSAVAPVAAEPVDQAPAAQTSAVQ